MLALPKENKCQASLGSNKHWHDRTSTKARLDMCRWREEIVESWHDS